MWHFVDTPWVSRIIWMAPYRQVVAIRKGCLRDNIYVLRVYISIFLRSSIFVSIGFVAEKEEDHYLLMKKQKKGNDNSENTSEVIDKMNKIIEAEKFQMKPVTITAFINTESVILNFVIRG